MLDFRENPRARGCAANRLFSLFVLVATRRRTAGGALCLPPSPCTLVAPYPQKSHTATRVAIFGGPIIGGSLIIERAQIHSFRICPSAYWGQKRKLRFPFLQVIVLIIKCAFQNRNFGLAHSICRILATSAGEVAALYQYVCH